MVAREQLYRKPEEVPAGFLLILYRFSKKFRFGSHISSIMKLRVVVAMNMLPMVMVVVGRSLLDGFLLIQGHGVQVC